MEDQTLELSDQKVEEFLKIYNSQEELLLKTRLSMTAFEGRKDTKGFEILIQRINSTIYEAAVRLIFKRGGSPFEFKGSIWTPTVGRCLFPKECGKSLILKSFDGKIHTPLDNIHPQEGSIVSFDSSIPINSKRAAINVRELISTYK